MARITLSDIPQQQRRDYIGYWATALEEEYNATTDTWTDSTHIGIIISITTEHDCDVIELFLPHDENRFYESHQPTNITILDAEPVMTPDLEPIKLSQKEPDQKISMKNFDSHYAYMLPGQWVEYLLYDDANGERTATDTSYGFILGADWPRFEIVTTEPFFDVVTGYPDEFVLRPDYCRVFDESAPMNVRG